MNRSSIIRQRKSLFLQPQNAPQRDSRPIREKTFQLECIKNLLDYLGRNGYDKPVSSKILSAPSAKDFQFIFKFLYDKFDPTFEYDKKFEDDVPNLLRSIKYPFANDISKSQLLAVGSMHAWPSLLAMLSWFVDLLNTCDTINLWKKRAPAMPPNRHFSLICHPLTNCFWKGSTLMMKCTAS